LEWNTQPEYPPKIHRRYSVIQNIFQITIVGLVGCLQTERRTKNKNSEKDLSEELPSNQKLSPETRSSPEPQLLQWNQRK